MIKNKYTIILFIFICSYIVYFSTFTVFRYRHIQSGYYDLGIMHQTVYNTYQAIKTGDLSRVLELTDPQGGASQIRRMSIHNDIILAFLAPFYFIHSGPETLLIVQTVVLALGALAVYKIAIHLLKSGLLSVAFAFAYLMYPPMQRANIFDFHAVTFATTFILYMVYFWLKGKRWSSVLFLILALLTKEEVGLSIGMFGIYAGLTQIVKKKGSTFQWNSLIYAAVVTVLSWGWSVLSVFWLIPTFRGYEHFAAEYYDDVLGNFGKYLFNFNTFDYLFYLVGPIGFFSLLSPEFILIAAPEFTINLLSSNEQLRSHSFHYTSVIQPWLFIGAIFGVRKIFQWKIQKLSIYIASTIFLSSLIFSYIKGPLPFAQEKNVDPWIYNRQDEYTIVKKWADKLSADSIKVSSTDEISPYFTSRRYFYLFSHNYTYADFVIVSVANIQDRYIDETVSAYEELKKDTRFEKIEEENGYEIYKKRHD